MTNKQIKNNLIQDMKKDIELKKYVKDIEDLNQKIIINIIDSITLLCILIITNKKRGKHE